MIAGLISGPIAAAAGAITGLWVRHNAREAAKQQMMEMLRGELSIFKESLLKDINGTYQRTGQCKEVHGRTEDRLAHLDQKIELARKLDEMHGFNRGMKEEFSSRLSGLEMIALSRDKGA